MAGDSRKSGTPGQTAPEADDYFLMLNTGHGHTALVGPTRAGKTFLPFDLGRRASDPPKPLTQE